MDFTCSNATYMLANQINYSNKKTAFAETATIQLFYSVSMKKETQKPWLIAHIHFVAQLRSSGNLPVSIFSAASAAADAALSKPNFCNSLKKPLQSVPLILYGLWPGPGNEPFVTSSLYSERALSMTSPTRAYCLQNLGVTWKN